YKHKRYPFFVKGIYETGMMAEVDDKFVLIDLRHIQKINAWGPEKVGGFEVFVSDENLQNKTQNLLTHDGDLMQQKADKIYDDYFFVDADLKVESLYVRFPSMMNWLDYLNTYIVIIIIIILIISIINMSSSLLILILEKTQMIGLLKGFGMVNGKIRKVFMYQSMFLIGRGLFFGNFFGIGLCLLQMYTGIIPLDKTAYYIDTMPVNLNLFHVLAINIATIITCIVMLIIPSFFVAKIDPVKAIRFN
ncbi:MAG: ABC transporter permease, partial [Flavobacteriales bacterium]